MWQIKLSDGSVLKNLSVNGTYFISDKALDVESLARNLKKIEIIAPENLGEVDNVPAMGAGEHEHVELTHTMTQDKKVWFSLREISRERLREIERDAKIDYLSMMSGIDLEV